MQFVYDVIRIFYYVFYLLHPTAVDNTNFKISVNVGCPTTLTCSFLEGYMGEARCRVEFVCEDNETVTVIVLSNNCIGGGEVSELLSVFLPPNTDFTYTALAVGDGCAGFVQPISASGSGNTGDCSGKFTSW